MRVTAGLYRSRLLAAPPGTHTRPTADRLRESLFNILSSRLLARGGFHGLQVADLYAGTGALGIEALSRGAAHCFFAEDHPPALKTLRANLASLKIPPSTVSVDEHGTARLLRTLAKSQERLDLVLLDPPYDRAEAYLDTLSALPPLLQAGALVVAEYSTRGFTPPEQVGMLEQTRLYPHGGSSLAFYEVVKPGPEPPHPDEPPSGDRP